MGPTYKGRAVDVKQLGRELGVRYVLEGSARKVAGRVRITGPLIDTTTGARVWADRYADLFEIAAFQLILDGRVRADITNREGYAGLI